MDEFNQFTPVEGPPAEGQPAAAQPAEAPAETTPPAPVTKTVSDAVQKFKSCRWRCEPDAGEFCTHRDVLPFAGKEGFKPDSWCPECAFYKLRRTPKRESVHRVVTRKSGRPGSPPARARPAPRRRTGAQERTSQERGD